MLTQIEIARSGKISPEVRAAARKEGVGPEVIRDGVARGTIAVLKNRLRRGLTPLAIGQGLKIKVNANIGSSRDRASVKNELKKLQAALEVKADTVMDLSTGEPVDKIRQEILENCPVPLGTVPIYGAALKALRRGKSFVELEPEEFFAEVELQAEQGVDFMTVHVGVNREAARVLKKNRRVLGVVSRGGVLTLEWMKYNRRENPFFENYDRLLQIARKYEIVLSLGDGMRPGCLADATDRSQLKELHTLGQLVRRSWEAGVQVMVEGPGHLPLNEIETNVLLEKKLCSGAPFYVLGPLVTDLGAGYDHITGAIGGALAAWAGADFLCYVTPSEHLALPDIEDVREGVIASRIAGHAADIARGITGAARLDLKMAKARKNLDWEAQIRLALDPQRARSFREKHPPAEEEVCTMCGEFCAIRVSQGKRPK
ncbi:MAG: phosphomethylpyrimidine synthase ThiC, partial [Proteobacteria bacterium]|nr:phosphomethylpyrimidine synthase ThiC [Pseudomonadota bacterium]